MITLKYINSTTPATQTFAGISNTLFDNVAREQVTTLSQRMYEHKFASRREWDIVISANELFGASNAKLAFLEEFWKAEQRFLRTDTVDTEVEEEMTFTRVVTSDGRTPREQIRNHKHLSQFKLTLIEALR